MQIIYLFSTISFLCVLLAIKFLRKRTANDILKDLRDDEIEQKIITKINKFNFIKQALNELCFLRILNEDELNNENRKIQFNIMSGALLSVALILLFTKAKLIFVCIAIIGGSCLGYLLAQAKLRARDQKFKQQIIFYLPVVMERIVMAVQAGLDIVPALKVIDELELSTQPKNVLNAVQNIDAVTLLLRRVVRLSEAGMSFEAAVNDVTSTVDNHSFKHALIHLAVAHKEGGEIIYPLRELSDATQLYFQESVEEDLAKMPIKATMPLLITFAGLIITFMAGPLIQIMNISSNPTYATQSANNAAEAKHK